MNSLLQQLFMVPGFRDGFLSAAPPLAQRSPVVDELQRLFAHLRDGAPRALSLSLSGPISHSCVVSLALV